MNVGFLGGTGIEAKGLALRFASAGATVVLGSRSRERASKAAGECNLLLGSSRIRGCENQEMLFASELIFLTVPFGQAVDAVETCAAFFAPGHILIDVTVPMSFQQGSVEYREQDGLSNAEVIAQHVPHGLQVVAAFKTIPAAILIDLGISLNCDVLVCSDMDGAKRKVMDLASTIPALRPLDGGPLKSARTLERMTVLAVELNRRYQKTGARFRIEGI